MGPAIYRTTKEGNLQKIQSGEIFEVTSFAIEEGRRGTVVVLQLKDGSSKRVFRRSVDEATFQFGNPGDLGTPAHEHRETVRGKHKRSHKHHTLKVPPPQQPVGTNGKEAHFTREELLTVHAALQSAADLTLRKLVQVIAEG